jgi:hypothetical protein
MTSDAALGQPSSCNSSANSSENFVIGMMGDWTVLAYFSNIYSYFIMKSRKLIPVASLEKS